MNDLQTVLCQKEHDAERLRREIQALRKVIPLLADDQPSLDDVMDLSLASSRTIAEPSGNGNGARDLKTTDDLFDNRSSPRTESMVTAAVQWAERIMRKIDGVYAGK